MFEHSSSQNRTRFFILVAIAALMALTLTACSGSSKSGATSTGAASASAAAQPEEFTLGSTIEFDNFSITFGSEYGTTELSNQFSEHDGATVITVPVSITNNDKESKSLNMYYVKEFGPKGTELDNITAYFMEDDARFAGQMRPGATLESTLYFLYDGDGDYYLTFNNMRSKVEVKIPVTL